MNDTAKSMYSERYSISENEGKPVKLQAWTFIEAAHRWAENHGKVGLNTVEVTHVITGDSCKITVLGVHTSKIEFQVQFEPEHKPPSGDSYL